MDRLAGNPEDEGAGGSPVTTEFKQACRGVKENEFLMFRLQNIEGFIYEARDARVRVGPLVLLSLHLISKPYYFSVF